jgi:hypothetical protein
MDRFIEEASVSWVMCGYIITSSDFAQLDPCVGHAASIVADVRGTVE